MGRGNLLVGPNNLLPNSKNRIFLGVGPLFWVGRISFYLQRGGHGPLGPQLAKSMDCRSMHHFLAHKLSHNTKRYLKLNHVPSDMQYAILSIAFSRTWVKAAQFAVWDITVNNLCTCLNKIRGGVVDRLR